MKWASGGKPRYGSRFFFSRIKTPLFEWGFFIGGPLGPYFELF